MPPLAFVGKPEIFAIFYFTFSIFYCQARASMFGFFLFDFSFVIFSFGLLKVLRLFGNEK